jgi:hypothetical protein
MYLTEQCRALLTDPTIVAFDNSGCTNYGVAHFGCDITNFASRVAHGYVRP